MVVAVVDEEAAVGCNGSCAFSEGSGTVGAVKVNRNAGCGGFAVEGG